MQSRMFCNISGLFPLDASSPHTLVMTKMSPDIATCHSGGNSPQLRTTATRDRIPIQCETLTIKELVHFLKNMDDEYQNADS